MERNTWQWRLWKLIETWVEGGDKNGIDKKNYQKIEDFVQSLLEDKNNFINDQQK